MGNVNKMVYSNEEYLYYHINRREYEKVQKILEKHPDLIDKPITKDTKHTLLMRAAFSMNAKSVEFVLNQGANPNIVTPKGETALTIAIRKNSIEIVQMLLKKGADYKLESKQGLSPLDLAILPGLMDIAKLIYDRLEIKKLKQSFEYEQIGKKYNYRYVNYRVFLRTLANEEEVQLKQEANYLIKQKPKLVDPVPDPRQSWGQWFKRNADFKDAPLVQRSSLPEKMQPQNRTLGKASVFIHNWVKSDAVTKSSYKPKENREVMSQMNDLIDRKDNKTEKMEINSVI